ncbi:unnamed protein product [Allacma fusca]|uniref:Uncharacterized protein n=1 Tax=Allacma fusca TaxID=39272 RepID=A0A8J2J9A1_9HEXA|nr:unnamed protein product [Allacma fusca]
MNHFILLTCFVATLIQVLEPTLAADGDRDKTIGQSEAPMDFSKIGDSFQLCLKDLNPLFTEVLSGKIDFFKILGQLKKSPACLKVLTTATSLCRGGGGMAKLMKRFQPQKVTHTTQQQFRRKKVVKLESYFHTRVLALMVPDQRTQNMVLN